MRNCKSKKMFTRPAAVAMQARSPGPSSFNGFDSNRCDQRVPCRDWSCAMIGQLRCDAEKQLLQVSCLFFNTGSIRVQQECMFLCVSLNKGMDLPPSWQGNHYRAWGPVLRYMYKTSSRCCTLNCRSVL